MTRKPYDDREPRRHGPAGSGNGAGNARNRLTARLAHAIIALSCLTASPPMAAAQDQPAKTDCTVPPQTDAPTGKTDHNPAPLAEKLDDCNGVLTPPTVGDKDIVTPAPDTGETPVINPGDVPADPTPKR